MLKKILFKELLFNKVDKQRKIESILQQNKIFER
jgi:hypothetical protein